MRMNQKMMKVLGGLAIVASGFWLLTPAHADLTATVSPGYTFGANERPTTSTLNRLGNPTITITGTLDGTNAGISAGSINANMFSSTVVDDASLDFTNSSPQALRIKSAGVKVREISSDIAGSGLAGGSGSALSVNVDDAGIGITNDVLTLKTNLSASYLGVSSNSVVVGASTNRGVVVGVDFLSRMMATNAFTSAEFSISAGAIANVAHGLGVTPQQVRWVLVCKTTDLNFAVEDEVPIEHFVGPSAEARWSAGGNTTNVFLTLFSSTGSTLIMFNKSTGNAESATLSRWRAKCYARP